MAKTSPTFSEVTYDRPTDTLRLSFGPVDVRIPRTMISELATLRAFELRRLEVGNAGLTISQRARDIDISVAGLIADVFGALAAGESGRRGGRRKSPKKAVAARKNGAKGGRPVSSAGSTQVTR